MTAEPLSDIPTGLELLRATYTSCAEPDDELPVVVSLFSGIEGIGAGLALSGFRTVVAVEWDKECQAVIRARFPEVRIFSDVREVDPDEIRAIVGGRRVIGVGGFPCQDVSVAGGRAGVAGTRSGLYVELVRIFDALDPDWLVVENVAGLLSADLDPDVNGGAGWGPGTAMAVVLRDLTGFAPPIPPRGWRNSGVCVGPKRSAAWRVLDARHTGVAQRRRRVFIVANPRDRAASAAVLLEPEGVRGNSPSGEPPRPRSARRVAPPAVRAGVAAADGARAGGAGTRGVLADEGVTSALTSALGGGGPDAAHAHAGWMVPTEAPHEVVAALTAAHHDYDRGDAAGETRLIPLDPSYVPDEAATLTAGVARSEGVNPPGRRQEDDVNLIVEGVGLGTDTSVAGTLGTPRAGGDTTGLDGKAAYVVECVTGDTTHALTSEGADASEDGTGRGTRIIATPPPWRSGKRAVEAELDPDQGAVPIDVRAGLRRDLRTGAGTQGSGIGEDGDPAPTLGVGSATPAVATFAKRKRAQTDTDDESWAEGDVAPTLNVNDVGDTRATVTIVEAFPIGQDALRGGEGAARTPSADAEGRVRLRDPGIGIYDDGDPAATVTAAGPGAVGVASIIEGAHDDLAGSVQTGGGKPGQGYQAVAFAVEPETGQGADLRARATDLSPAVTVTDHAKQTDRGVRVTTDAAVRRLTPIECERLQGFPDPWLLGLGLSDSAMYRMLGNAVCVSVSGFLGWRLAAWIRGWRP